MEKLLRGIVEFQSTKADSYRELFAKLTLGQRPDSFFIACSDSRVAANVFASTDPGDLFVMRNVGNLFPKYQYQESDYTAQAALEFAVHEIKVKHIIICGHSECGAMNAIWQGMENIQHDGLKQWLRNTNISVAQVIDWNNKFPQLSPVNALSQLNTIQQLENIKSYPFIEERLNKTQIQLHGIWFDIKNLLVKYYFQDKHLFEPITSVNLNEILNLMK